jgi:hypothetical protein
MNCKIKVFLLGIIALIFSIYGYIICEKVINHINDTQSIAHLKQLEKFICAFMALSIVMSVASLLPTKWSKKRIKRVK